MVYLGIRKPAAIHVTKSHLKCIFTSIWNLKNQNVPMALEFVSFCEWICLESNCSFVSGPCRNITNLFDGIVCTYVMVYIFKANQRNIERYQLNRTRFQCLPIATEVVCANRTSVIIWFIRYLFRISNHLEIVIFKRISLIGWMQLSYK